MLFVVSLVLTTSFEPDSEISRFNRSRDVDQWFPVSEDTARVVHAAQEIATATAGATEWSNTDGTT